MAKPEEWAPHSPGPGFIRRRFRRWVVPALVLWAVCGALFVAGLVVEDALACPDLVPGTSDGSLPKSWQLFPPGPRCYYPRVRDDLGRGNIETRPGPARGLLVVTLILWP